MSDPFVGKYIRQPKKEIMTFLASRGVRVPVIYDSIDDAMQDAGEKDILLRSEHPQDYEGSSDLFPTLDPRYDLGRFDDPSEILFNAAYSNKLAKVRLHCKLLGLDFESFKDGLSYSAWEGVNGINRVITADSAIRGKYHIISINRMGYSVVSGDDAEELTDAKHTGILIGEAKGLIGLYEQIRSLLDPNHCYIVETVSVPVRGIGYDCFGVQVHRGVDFANPTFSIDDLAANDNNLFLHNVRGATSPAGESLLLTLRYPPKFRTDPWLIPEQASMEADDYLVHQAFTEINLAQRRLHVFKYNNSYELGESIDGHTGRNIFLKPHCSAMLPVSVLARGIDTRKLDSEGLEQRQVLFVSDGNSAFLRFLE